jgi:hypothetical protein
MVTLNKNYNIYYNFEEFIFYINIIIFQIKIIFFNLNLKNGYQYTIIRTYDF